MKRENKRRNKYGLLIALIIFMMAFQSTSVSASASSVISLTSSYRVIKKGGVFRLFYGINAPKYYGKKVVWSSSKKKVASVTKAGWVKGKKKGSATITVKIKGTKQKAKCKVIVGYPVTSIKFSKQRTTLFVGERTKLSVSVAPSNASVKSVTYISSNPNVLAVAQDGTIAAVSPGDVKVTAISNDGNEVFADTCISVKAYADLGNNPQSQNVKKIMTLISAYSDFIKQYGYHFYKDGNNPVLTYPEALNRISSGQQVPVNCATPINWALNELGFMPEGQIYGRASGGFRVTNSDSKTIIKQYADFISISPAIGLCVQDASDAGSILYGDILSININGTNHTVVYAGRDEEGKALAYEAGGNAQSKGYSNVGCGPLDYSKSTYSKYAINEILRFR